MIRIENIHIKEFRGIRDFELTLGGKNFAACGPNGTGKSGIVDAIEFALTGNISRLSGAGTGGLSVKQHGPHVDSRDKPEAASVVLEVTIPSLGNKKARIERNVKSPNAAKITPKDPDVLTVFRTIALHPEFVLSRRELIRFVLSEPSQRAKEVQALLRLDEIDKLRGAFQKIANALTRDLDGLSRRENDAVTSLMAALRTAELSASAVLNAVNPQREILGLSPIASLEATTSLKDGLSTVASASSAVGVPKQQVDTDLSAVRDALAVLESAEFTQASAEAAALAIDLQKDAASLNGLTRAALLNSALDQYDGAACPVCDTPFEPGAFEEHLAQKLAHLDDVSKKRQALELKIKPLLDGLHAAGSALNTMIGHAARLMPPVDVAALAGFRSMLRSRYQQLNQLLPLDDTALVLGAAYRIVDIDSAMNALAAGVAGMPEPSKRDAARDFLVVAEERLEALQDARQKLSAGRLKAARATKVSETYGIVTTAALEKIYQDVEGTFATFYRKINEEDEDAFTAKLMPSIGKLALDVDFYGRGHFPPGAYHSEGHQDGMGLCLYLALMDHLQGKGFTFAVLDDVLMSVDAGHRREVCTLLKQVFTDTQFIFTTHDEIWLRHMKSEGLIKGRNFAHFRTWTVDVGPTEWDDRDVWTEIDDYLAKNDVRAAAGLLRHFLEHFAKEACDRLRADVEFRGDAQFMLGDLLPNATSALGKLLRAGKAAAQSWGQNEILEKITALDTSFIEAKTKSSVETWQINTAVHYNAWADLQKKDFAPVVTAYRALTKSFSCPSCNEMYAVEPARGKQNGIRCGCSVFNLNAKHGKAS